MRTINADELKTAFPLGEYVRTECVRATIDHMQTIEAIPIEWLLKKKASCIHMSNRASQTAWLIGELIKEWQKEIGGAYK